MGNIFRFLGLTVGLNLREMSPLKWCIIFNK
jgi:preprotein translocase subunit SecA